MGLPGAGKSTLSQSLLLILKNADWYNADLVRKEYNDWDFSSNGRRRQTLRMKQLAEESISNGRYAICDFVCPTLILQQEFAPDFLIFQNTIEKSRFNDTNLIFQPPVNIDYEITSDNWWNVPDSPHIHALEISKLIKNNNV